MVSVQRVGKQGTGETNSDLFYKTLWVVVCRFVVFLAHTVSFNKD